MILLASTLDIASQVEGSSSYLKSLASGFFQDKTIEILKHKIGVYLKPRFSNAGVSKYVKHKKLHGVFDPVRGGPPLLPQKAKLTLMLKR